MRVTISSEILSPPASVFPWIAEPEKAMRWQKNVRGGQILIDRPERIGTTFKEVIEEGGQSLEMQGTITKYVENEVIGFHLVSKIHELDVTYTVEAFGGTTKLSIEAVIEWKFPLSVVSLFMGRKMEGDLRNQMSLEVAELKRLCETE